MSGDLLLQGGLVVDGTGKPGVVADVLVVDGRVADVRPNIVPPAGGRQLKVDGFVVAPGFIDVHTHYDAQLCWDPALEAISQYGITTIVIGNCGIGIAPLRPGGASYLIQLLARVEGMPVPALEQAVSWDWLSFADYLDEIDRPSGVNVVPLLGHSPLRYAAMGDASYERSATAAELETMQEELRSALAAGAWGFSSSVAGTHNDLAGRPAPSRLADRTEFEALADVVGEFPFGIIGISPESKLRGLSPQDRSLLQMLSIRGGASVNWNPLLHSAAMPDLWQQNLSASEEAAEAGARVFGVFSPASTGGNRVDLDTLFLFSFLPHWKPLATLTNAERTRAFADPGLRADLADDLENDTSMGALTAKLRSMWDILRVTVAFAAENQVHVGRLVGDIARETSRSPLDTMLDIAVLDDLRTVFMQEDPRYYDDDSKAAFAALSASPYVLFGGSDAGAHVDMLANESLPIRTLQWRVHDDQTLSLEEGVRRFTSAVADAIGLAGRGTLRPGQAGDIVVFDIATASAGDAYVLHDLPGGGERMMTDAKGVAYTIVDGEVVFDHGKPTGVMTGRLLRSGMHHT